ncbi:hypothetical protein [uncultured Roseibium sp.]|uniref:hypothetical protein n=1 Tax=uncultured Roseibium sp. TaxID=1936171 RepID=UPI003216D8C9
MNTDGLIGFRTNTGGIEVEGNFDHELAQLGQLCRERQSLGGIVSRIFLNVLKGLLAQFVGADVHLVLRPLQGLDDFIAG